MVPLGIIFQLIKQVQIRHAISIIFGFVFQYFLFENELYVPLVQTLIVYVLIITFKERCGKIVFYESFLFLVSFQTYKMITEYSKLPSPPLFIGKLPSEKTTVTTLWSARIVFKFVAGAGQGNSNTQIKVRSHAAPARPV